MPACHQHTRLIPARCETSHPKTLWKQHVMLKNTLVLHLNRTMQIACCGGYQTIVIGRWKTFQGRAQKTLDLILIWLKSFKYLGRLKQIFFGHASLSYAKQGPFIPALNSGPKKILQLRWRNLPIKCVPLRSRRPKMRENSWIIEMNLDNSSSDHMWDIVGNPEVQTSANVLNRVSLLKIS